MKNRKKHLKMKIARTVEALNQNGMVGYHITSLDHLFEVLSELVKDGDLVSLGGSMTLFETGVVDWLRERDIVFLDRYKKGLKQSQIDEIRIKAFGTDVYFASSNAVTETGHLFNVDGYGNRVAAMIYGPKKVVLVVGSNKIVPDDDAAIERNRRYATPLNNMRLNRNSICAKTGYCTDSCSPGCVSSSFVFLRNQMIHDRIHVLILEDEYGY